MILVFLIFIWFNNVKFYFVKDFSLFLDLAKKKKVKGLEALTLWVSRLSELAHTKAVKRLPRTICGFQLKIIAI